MKPPPRKRRKPDRNLQCEPPPRKKSHQWQQAEQSNLLKALKRLNRTTSGREDIDYAFLNKNVPTRSTSEIQSVVEFLKNEVISTASFKLKKKTWEEKKDRKPIQVWTRLASTMAGALEEPISTAFSQMLIISSTEPRTLRNCDPPQVYRPPTDEHRPAGRTVPFRPMPHLPVKVERPDTKTARPLVVVKTPAPAMRPAKRLTAPSQVIRVLKLRMPPPQQQLSNTAGTSPAATSTSQSAAASTSQPAATSTSQSAASSTSQPAATSTSQPAVASTSQPAAASTSQPAAASISQPAAASTSQSAATSISQPAASSTSQPAATSTSQPAAASTSQPAAASISQPAASSTSQPAATSCQPGAAEILVSPSASTQTATPVTGQVAPSRASATAVKTKIVSGSLIRTTQQPPEQNPNTSSTSKSTSSAPHTPLSSSATSQTPVPSAVPVASSTQPKPPLSTSAAAFHAKFGRTSKYATKDSPRVFGVKSVVDFERIYRYLSAIHQPTDECHLTPMESAIVLDLLMSLPEELPKLDCNKLHKHLLQMYQFLSSTADSQWSGETFTELKDRLRAQTEEAPSGPDSNRTNSGHNTAATAEVSDVSADSGAKKKQQPDEAESQSSGSSNTSCHPPLNPFMVPLKLLKRK